MTSDIDNRTKVRAYYMWLGGSRLGEKADYYEALEIERHLNQNKNQFNFDRLDNCKTNGPHYSIPLLDNFNVPGHWLFLNYSGNHPDGNDERFSYF